MDITDGVGDQASAVREHMTAQTSPFTDIATLWQRGFVRCVLSGDGVTCALILQQDDRILKATRMPDEATAIGAARAWLRDHEGRRAYRAVGPANNSAHNIVM
jgi:hypothetical protein